MLCKLREKLNMLTSMFLQKMNKGDFFFFKQNNHFLCGFLCPDPQNLALISTGY